MEPLAEGTRNGSSLNLALIPTICYINAMSNTLGQKHSLPEISEDELEQIKMKQRRAQLERWNHMSPEERAALIKSQFPATTNEPEDLFTGMEL